MSVVIEEECPECQDSSARCTHGVKVMYCVDFAYTISKTSVNVVKDVKGGKATQTAVFRLKRKLFCRRYPHLWHRVVTEATEPI